MTVPEAELAHSPGGIHKTVGTSPAARDAKNFFLSASISPTVTSLLCPTT